MAAPTPNQDPEGLPPRRGGGPAASSITVPTPDPTQLTTEQLRREISWLRELLQDRVTGSREVIEVRLNSMDRAVTLIQDAFNKAPDAARTYAKHEEKFISIEKDIGQRFNDLEKWLSVKFGGVQTQFAERDTRTEQISLANKLAIDAALQAAKEAVGEQNKSNVQATAKSEAAFTKQIDQVGTLIATSTKALDDKVNDMKDRINAIDLSSKTSVGGLTARSEGKNEGLSASGAIVLGIFAGLAVLVSIAALIFEVTRH